MFSNARIKLTLWYLLIISLITISFSIGVYKISTREFDRIVRLQRYRIENPDQTFITPSSPSPRRLLDVQVIEESQERIRAILALIDLGVIFSSAILGYFLAGRTLAPIEAMIDEQKRFTADASHEIRTPLTALKSEIEVALRDKKLSLKEVRELLLSNLEEVDKLKDLSDNLLKMSKYQSTDMSLSYELINLKELIKESVKRVSSLAKSKQITIKSSVEKVTFTGNDKSLTETLVVLLDNAIKFSLNNQLIKIKGREDEGHIIIEVVDRGVGINAEDLPHIFNRFYGKGYGLGLSIAKRIVELHHGSISVSSQLNKGATFTIKLPV